MESLDIGLWNTISELALISFYSVFEAGSTVHKCFANAFDLVLEPYLLAETLE
jgi:hypothetical protein